MAGVARTYGFLAGIGCVAMIACAVSAQAATPRERAVAARTCSVPDYPGNGYFTSLTVRHVDCATGRRVMRAHYRCRTAHGPKGRCHRRVLHYRCSETRYSIPTEINARVTCRRGERRVVYTYQQNT